MACRLARERTHLAHFVQPSITAMSLFVLAIVQVESAMALDVGAGVGAAGLGAEVSASTGSGGVSAGAGLGSGGIGASVGGSIGPSGVGAGGNVDGSGSQGISGGVGASLGSNGAPTGGGTSSQGPSTNGSGVSGVGSVGTGTSGAVNGANPNQQASDEARSPTLSASIAPPAHQTPSREGVTIPNELLPTEKSGDGSGWFRSIYLLPPLRAKPGTPLSVVQSCRSALIPDALRYGATQVDVASAGRIVSVKGNGFSAPVEARIMFQRNNHVQVRQARISCRLDHTGRIVAVF